MSIKLDHDYPRERIIYAYNMALDRGWIPRNMHYDIVDYKGSRYVRVWKGSNHPASGWTIPAKDLIEATEAPEPVISGKTFLVMP